MVFTPSHARVVPLLQTHVNQASFTTFAMQYSEEVASQSAFVSSSGFQSKPDTSTSRPVGNQLDPVPIAAHAHHRKMSRALSTTDRFDQDFDTVYSGDEDDQGSLGGGSAWFRSSTAYSGRRLSVDSSDRDRTQPSDGESAGGDLTVLRTGAEPEVGQKATQLPSSTRTHRRRDSLLRQNSGEFTFHSQHSLVGDSGLLPGTVAFEEFAPARGAVSSLEAGSFLPRGSIRTSVRVVELLAGCTCV